MRNELYNLCMMGKSSMRIAGTATLFLVVITLLVGAYTGVCTVMAQVAFPAQAQGSVVEAEGKSLGSTLVAQPFNQPGHLWGRAMLLDFTSFRDEDGTPLLWAKPSNLSPVSDEFSDEVAECVAKIREAHLDMRGVPVPSDLVTNSGSGFDPHISPLAAQYQVKRLVSETGKSAEEVRAIIEAGTEPAFLGMLGQDRVNVLKVNLMLEGKEF